MGSWKIALELDSELIVRGGSNQDLQEAIRGGADLRIYTEFYHHEHLEPGSKNQELIQEVSDFRVTYLVDDRWVAGIMNLRMPINPPVGFGPRPSTSFFLYNQNGHQGIARPYLDGNVVDGAHGPAPLDDHSNMPKYRQYDGWDSGTNAPSSNFTYHFETFRYLVCDDWLEVFAHADDGRLIDGSIALLTKAFVAGSEIKVAIRGLCDDLGGEIDHEVFVHIGPGYYSTEREIFSAGSQPVVRVKPAIPVRYESEGWDFGWLMVRTDGFVERWLCNPYTLEFRKSESRCAVRWFVR